jgi:dipeptidyl aminopeptidase/acylaminoacyl peptidase
MSRRTVRPPALLLLLVASAPVHAAPPVSVTPYPLPTWEKAVEATDVEKYADRSEYEGAAADASFVLEKISYAATNGPRVFAYGYRPASGARRPTIVFNRGSWIRGDIGPELLPMLHRLAREGFAVIAPLYRGSGGAEGKDEMGGEELADLMAVPGLAASLPWMSPDYLFLYGESRGGMMVLQALRDGFPARAAAVFGAFTDLDAMLADPKWAEAARSIWPDLAANRAAIVRRRSAVAWPEAISAPLLIMHGGADGAVSPLQSLDLATRLQMLGKPYGLIVFEGDGHTLNANRVERDRQAAGWFRKRL